MSSGTLRLTGVAGLVWGLVAILAFILIIVVGAGAVSSAMKNAGDADAARRAAAAVSGAPILKIIQIVGALALMWMLFQLAQVFRGGMGAMVCYATLVVTLVLVVLGLLSMAGIITLVLTVLQGIGLLFVGIAGLMSKPVTNGSFKGFSILMIVLGACSAIIVLAFLYPFLALAAGIVLFVSMNGAAKQAA
ncbi:MAG: hypothetical protein KIT16_21060 [Rhodospirillaceae bacterium]|nr:hypothetical protein [Rhodospirillaceae bacterium]